MNEPSAMSQILGFLAFLLLVAVIYGLGALVARTMLRNPVESEPVPADAHGWNP